MPGVLTPARRAPTPEEVADINARLKTMEEDPDAPMATAPRPQPPAKADPGAAQAGDLPIGRRPE